ncbi:conjugal transfer protein [Enterobacter hormaechei]|nr:conjugal transfer protein [Enterobacter hormaechei]ELD3190755.1 conjugal transfer protein [Enterobacter hormaechei]
MAAMDPIHFEPVYKLFPSLTLLQATDVCLYSIGASYREIGEHRGVSSETIKKSLEAAQKKLSIFSLQSLKAVFLCRLFIKLSLPTGDRSSDEKIHTDDFDLTSSDIKHFYSVLPELSPKLLNYVLLFCSGYEMGKIGNLACRTEDDVRKGLEMAMGKLNVGSLQSLQQLTLARLILNLTLGSFKRGK